MHSIRSALALAGLLAPTAAQQPDGLDLPFQWVENCGQWPGSIAYSAMGGGLSATLGEDGLMLAVPDREAKLKLSWTGWTQVFEKEHGPTTFSFFQGNDPERWVGDIPGSTAVRVTALPGIELVLRQGESGLRYDVEAEPGADLEALVFSVEAAELTLRDGALVMRGEFGEVVQTRPVAWEEDVHGTRKPVTAEFELFGQGDYGFRVPDWNRNQRLIIDPTLQVDPLYATWFYDIWDTVVDEQGRPLLCGTPCEAIRSEFITAAFGDGVAEGAPIYVARLDPSSTVPDRLTIVGGSGVSLGLSMALDPVAQRVYVTGTTSSSDFPVTDGSGILLDGSSRAPVFALQANLSQLAFSTILPETSSGNDLAVTAGSQIAVTGYVTDPPMGLLEPIGPLGGSDAFAVLLDASGQAVGGFRIGGPGSDSGNGVGVGSDGAVYIGGRAMRSSFPTSDGAFRTGTASGGGGRGKKGTAADNDLFLLRFDPTFVGPEYSTLLGGSGEDLGSGTNDRMMAVNGTRVVVHGRTTSSDLIPAPTVDTTLDGTEDGLVIVLEFAGFVPGNQPGLVMGTYFGGGADDAVNAVSFDAAGRLHVVGRSLGRTSSRKGKKGGNSAPFPAVDNGTGFLKEPPIANDGFYAILDPDQPTLSAMLLYSSGVGADASTSAFDIELGPTGVPHFLMRANDPMPTTPTAVFTSSTTCPAWFSIYPARL